MVEVNPPGYLENRTDHKSQVDRMVLAALLWPGAVNSGSFQMRSGVIPGGGGATSTDGLQVQAQGSPNMSVKVRPGNAIIQGTENSFQGAYFCLNDADVTLTVATADATNLRKDIVVAEILDAFYSGASNLWRLRCITGPVPGGAEPAVPANAVKLAVITVNAAATSITSGNISDSRPFIGARGGMIPILSTGRPTTPVMPGLIFETDTKKAYLYDGTAYRQILVENAAWGSTDQQPKKFANIATSSTNGTTTYTNDSVSSVAQGLTFNAPPSGKVWLRHMFMLGTDEDINAVAAARAVVRTGSTIGSGTIVYASDTDVDIEVSYPNVTSTAGRHAWQLVAECLVTGLTPGSAYNTHLQHKEVTAGMNTTINSRLIQIDPVLG